MHVYTHPKIYVFNILIIYIYIYIPPLAWISILKVLCLCPSPHVLSQADHDVHEPEQSIHSATLQDSVSTVESSIVHSAPLYICMVRVMVYGWMDVC